ncbi:hypothetical protein MTR62_10535 [Novosphingobium sp. 1949]|uniref:Sulfotransferase family protein n=1 Tax=Novosphingobium organovorum TaxID=2930092 RepID=A0ABT0BDJ9_9SPHN|nr:hypothetical protein [Novosphingobium organovorum]MCJ2183124.1 hypothetical protein [Novosphingobium organovorum]
MTTLIHPGFHKTGTTWLQAELFKDARVFHSLFSHFEIDDMLVRPHDFAFDAERARLAIEARASQKQPGQIDVISSEILSGNPFTGARDARTNADRLHQVLPDAHILLTVRAQKSMLRSLYMQYAQRGGRRSLDEFATRTCEPGYFWFDLDLIQFHRLAEYYGALFGHDKVLVLPQELLARDRDEYFRTLYRFLTGQPPAAELTVSRTKAVGASAPSAGVPLLRLANLIRKAPLNPEAVETLNPLGKLLHRAAYNFNVNEKSARRKLAAQASRHIDDRYAASNRILQRYCPVSLADLGYAL